MANTLAAQPGIEERLMIAGVLAGDHYMFQSLIRPHEKMVYCMVFSFLHNEADAQDACQEALSRAFINLASFRGDSQFGTWLISIARNEARRRLRQLRGHRTDSIESSQVEGKPISHAHLRDTRDIPSEALEKKVLSELLWSSVATLPSTYRDVFVLRDVEGLSISQAARVLDVSIGSVKIRLHRARLMLRQVLGAEVRYSRR